MSKPLSVFWSIRHLLESSVVCSLIWEVNFEWWRQEEQCKWTQMQEQEEAGLLLANSHHGNCCAQVNPKWPQEDGGKTESIAALGSIQEVVKSGFEYDLKINSNYDYISRANSWEGSGR